jgi:hypothetical protein
VRALLPKIPKTGSRRRRRGKGRILVHKIANKNIDEWGVRGYEELKMFKTSDEKGGLRIQNCNSQLRRERRIDWFPLRIERIRSFERTLSSNFIGHVPVVGANFGLTVAIQ